MKSDIISGITLLGKGETNYPTEYSPDLLEAFDNKFPDRDYFVEFNCPEFTCLCPITGQPDFAKITVKYIPNVKMVESKSLKLYLFSFRNHGGFHEESVNIILRDLVNLMNPKYIEVLGEFTPRGGISIHPFVNYGSDEKWQDFAMRRMEKY
jgi:7-cyano-7-deazaguanine reductase